MGNAFHLLKPRTSASAVNAPNDERSEPISSYWRSVCHLAFRGAIVYRCR